MLTSLQLFMRMILGPTEHIAKISLCHELGRGSKVLALILVY